MKNPERRKKKHLNTKTRENNKGKKSNKLIDLAVINIQTHDPLNTNFKQNNVFRGEVTIRVSSFDLIFLLQFLFLFCCVTSIAASFYKISFHFF